MVSTQSQRRADQSRVGPDRTGQTGADFTALAKEPKIDHIEAPSNGIAGGKDLKVEKKYVYAC